MPDFAGRRFSHGSAEGTERLPYCVPSGTNSGALAIKVARHLGAKRILLLGYDGHGTHFFGPHPEQRRGLFKLNNTTDKRRHIHILQHRQEAEECARAGVEVWNCSPGTAIPHYPIAQLSEALTWQQPTC